MKNPPENSSKNSPKLTQERLKEELYYEPENGIDHIDRNPSNNKWENLREVSQSCNMRNSKKCSTNTSGITGVCYYKNRQKWVAQIKTNKPILLGYFPTKQEAALARYEAEVKYEFPNCNTTSSAYLYLREKGAL